MARRALRRVGSSVERSHSYRSIAAPTVSGATGEQICLADRHGRLLLLGLGDGSEPAEQRGGVVELAAALRDADEVLERLGVVPRVEDLSPQRARGVRVP